MPSLPGMRAGGFYDQHSTGQRASIEPVFDWIDALLPGIPRPAAADRPFTLADYGCSEGGNSLRTGNSSAYAEALAGFLQAFSEPVVRAGLPASPDFDLVSAIYDRARERVRETPEAYQFVYIQAACVYSRR